VSDDVDLFTQQESNRRRSRWLVGSFIAFFAWLGFGGDLILYLSTQGAPANEYRHVLPLVGLGTTILGAGIAWMAWKDGPSKILWASGAWELLTPSGPEQEQLVNVVEEMAIASGLPRPRIFIMKDADPNALATGQDPQRACIAVTEGLLATCTRDELQAVIAHEMGHIKNLDTRLMTLLASLVGAIALVHEGVGRMLRFGRVPFGGEMGRGRKGGGKGGGPILVALVVLWVVSWLLAPLVSRLLALSVSRKREYLADAMSAQFTRNPLALASALAKIEAAAEPTRSVHHGSAHLCIADPTGRSVSEKQGFLADVLATHPPMAIRISRLKAMGYQDLKREGSFVTT
jgi:heat shock protein HtpX